MGCMSARYARRRGLLPHLLELAGAEIERSRDMIAALPFPTLEVEQSFSLAVQVGKPLAMLRVGITGPGPLVDFAVPLFAIAAPGHGPGHGQGNQSLDVDPPEFLVPLELLGGMALDVEIIENAPIPRVPA